MYLNEVFVVIMFVVFALIIIIPLIVFVWIYIFDARQSEHSVLRNYPLLGNIRYLLENIGPELRQYLFANNREGKPFNRHQYESVVKSGKYLSRIHAFGSERDFKEPGFYIRNSMFPLLHEELRIIQEPKIETRLYQINHEGLFNRKEQRKHSIVDPHLLAEEDAVIIGDNTCREPFKAKGLIGQSAMSYGSLGKNAITALSKGLGLAGGTWMNTGEGGLSKHHLRGEVDIIMQIGPGLFGVRTEDGDFSWELFKKKSETVQVKAFELKLAQGAKTRGGHILGEKVTPEIAEIRNVRPWQTIDSPNRFREFKTTEELMNFVAELRAVGGKPVGVKMVAGSKDEVEKFVREMAELDKTPDFITIDGAEGGSGATFQELSDAAGLPLFSALPLLDEMLKKYGIRDRLKIIASGKLVTPDKIAFALCLGADLVNTARGMMISVGCIMAQVCHNNTCPVGVATTDPKREKALVIEEKMYRVTNYVLSLREGLFNLAAAAGVASPTELSEEHLMYRTSSGQLMTGYEFKKSMLILPPELVDKEA
ncbi:FMN-binding glutamate synthase family protein [Lederbergia citrea]|uniref:FMN-binding glutamate synthase family protein n=1 Tax=Lederbergia citrea TaxID=2833581 RepID=A0A942UR47_9BACI|nr:FMN-binding glutamate synthase family protein [Lederbergia citrea]MBS4204642.1 FMN-binding glutamate synthase family protein [Lederbergia citrea]MBS4223511.1 FMN-binding glutamate synthase family protein [Lederbergia citrea]